MKEKYVIMAEKKNAGEDIAKALDVRNIQRVGKNRFIRGTIKGEEVSIVWSNGHCLQLLEPEQIDPKFAKWNDKDLPIPFDDKKLVIIPEKTSLYKEIKQELETATYIINAGDAGREGELIQRWLIDKICGRKKTVVFRMWCQSLTSKAIKEAFDNLLGADDKEAMKLDNLYNSGRARAVMDKYLGYNYSRLLSITKTRGFTINYGRCKSPLTHAIIQRDEEIEDFKSVPFYYIIIDITKNDKTMQAEFVNDKKKRIDFEKREDAEGFLEQIGKFVTVDKINSQIKKQTAPLPYDILAIQKAMAKQYNYEASETLEICQALYDQYHILSYPRTDSRYLTTDLKQDLKDILPSLAFGKFNTAAVEAINSFIPDKYFNDGKVADHHALIPQVPDNGSIEKVYQELKDKEKNVFDHIVKGFLALWLPNYEFKMVEVTFTNDKGMTFLIKGKEDISLGWKAVFKGEEEDDNNENPTVEAFKEKEKVLIDKREIINSKTTPKKRFTTASLLDFMKMHHIGTGATRDSIIKELTEKKGKNKESFIAKEGQYFISTDFGRKVDKVIPESLKSIEYLGALEQQIENIAIGKNSMEDFLKTIDEEFKENKAIMTINKEEIITGEIFAEKETEYICPECGAKLINRGWGYGCKNWTNDGSGCSFSIGKKYGGKTLSDKVINQLLKDGKTKNKLKLKSKEGKAYEAYLIFEKERAGKWKMKVSF